MVVVEWDKPFTFKDLSSCGVYLARILIYKPFDVFDVMLHQVYGVYKPMRVHVLHLRLHVGLKSACSFFERQHACMHSLLESRMVYCFSWCYSSPPLCDSMD
jgi:hypothetical protein